MVAITGIISEPESQSQIGRFTEMETISVTLAKKAPLPRPFFRLENGIKKEVEATAYTFQPGDLTFTETKPGWGTIAVDPEFIGLGSVVCFPDIFPGVKFLAVDTGKKIKGWAVDIWMPSENIAKLFGRQKLMARIQKPLAG